VRIGFVVALFLASPASAQAPGEVATTPPKVPALHRSGGLHLGVHLEPPYLGSIQAISAFGHAVGTDVGIAVQVDLNKRWAFRLPLELGAGGFGDGAGYGELALIPGLLYRFRDTDDQRWVTYVGGGTRFGLGGIGRVLINQPLIVQSQNVACCHDWGDGGWSGGGGGGHSDPNTELVIIGLSPELWVGGELRLSRWVLVNFAGSVAFERTNSTSVVVLRETVGLRATF
jgi:hypothetical protein